MMSPTGHLAVGFAVKHWKTKIPLLWFLIGSYAIDFIYLGLLFMGVERFGYNPWSHSLLMAVGLSFIVLVITELVTKHWKSAYLMGAVVFSHWVLDFIVWDNLPLAFEKDPGLGLGLYNIIGFDINVPTLNTAMIIATGFELALLIVGLLIYYYSRRINASTKGA